MRVRKNISIIILGVYAIVMAHGFIPHHHHSQPEEPTRHCEHSDHQPHYHHSQEKNGDGCIDHSQEHDPVRNCSFDEETILAKSLDLSELFVPSSEIKLPSQEQTKESASDKYLPLNIRPPNCRNILQRGPPAIS